MTKQEFENYIVGTVTDEEYTLIELAYLYHPSCKDKVTTGKLWNLGGLPLFRDMMPRTFELIELEKALYENGRECGRISAKIEIIRSGQD